MREIKFRAWDKKNKRMCVMGSMTFKTGCDKKLKIISEGFKDGSLRFINDEKHFDDIYLDSKNIELMQFTGLKDKNGKDIYEGDIVSIKEINGIRRTGVVIFTSFAFKLQVYVTTERGGSWKEKMGITNSENVTGNIYENPELMSEGAL